MKSYQYIIVGGGMAGSAAVMGIRENDPDGTIAMFSQERYGPYNRPPLTKGLWDGKNIEDILRPMDKFNVELILETTVKQIFPDENSIETENGDQYKYEKLLLATGGDPIRLPDSPEGVIFYRTRDDYHKLQTLTETKNDFCVIGGGFIGSEITAALTKHGKKVTMIFPETGISGLRFPGDLSEFLNEYYREKGVTILNNRLVKSIKFEGNIYNIQHQDIGSEEVSNDSFESVLVGIGIRPNTLLAENAGITVNDGILVNEYLQTDYPDIYAAGDVTCFKNLRLEKRMRVEHEDNANKMGMTAGLNMSGDLQKYDHFPFFYSDLFDLGFEAIGELNKEFKILEDWFDPYKKGTIFYLDEGKIQGIIFWNLWGKVDQGRELIVAGDTYKVADLKGMFTE